jgi:hypothetical protein
METSASASPGTGRGPEKGDDSEVGLVPEPMAMNEPQEAQNMRPEELGASQFQQSIVREGTTGTWGGCATPSLVGGGAGWRGGGLASAGRSVAAGIRESQPPQNDAPRSTDAPHAGHRRSSGTVRVCGTDAPG